MRGELHSSWLEMVSAAMGSLPGAAATTASGAFTSHHRGGYGAVWSHGGQQLRCQARGQGRGKVQVCQGRSRARHCSESFV